MQTSWLNERRLWVDFRRPAYHARPSGFGVLRSSKRPDCWLPLTVNDPAQIRPVRERPYMDSPSFASTLLDGDEVRLLTYIRPL